jgi:16S rRNA (uracil1498-N3)-methyltransferase
MYRFFVSPEQLEIGDQGFVQAAHITGAEAAHAARVLRLDAGTQVVVCDGAGMEYLAILEEVSPTRCYVRVTTQRQCPAEPVLRVCLFQGLAKGEKMDWIVQKCTELGVAAVYPIQTTYSVVRLDDAKALARTERWQKIAQEAAKQCGRAVPPRIYTPTSLSVAVNQVQVRQIIIPWETAALPLSTALRQALLREERANVESGMRDSGVIRHDASSYDLGIVIGPEGGLSADEVQPLLVQGGTPVTLGPRILRTETAAIATLTAALYEYGDFGGSRSMTEWR